MTVPLSEVLRVSLSVTEIQSESMRLTYNQRHRTDHGVRSGVRAVALLILQRLQHALGAFNSFQPHDNIVTLERPQIPQIDKAQVANVKSCSRLGVSHRFFGMPTFGTPPMAGDSATRLRGRGTKHRASEEVTVDCSGMPRPQHQTYVRWSDGAGFSYTWGPMVQPCVGG